MKLAEDQGFDYGWTYDSHVLWQEFRRWRCGGRDAQIKLGHMVTNPGAREPRASQRLRRCRTSPRRAW